MFLTFWYSNIKKKGRSAKKPSANLTAEKVYGPIKSIPISCAIKAVPQMNEHAIAQVKDTKFLLILFIMAI